MRKIFTLIVALIALSVSALAQENSTPADSVVVAPRYSLDKMYSGSEQLEDAVAQSVAKGIATNPNQLNNRYKLYPTNNVWTFLKLDTCLGYVWQVQYTVNNDNRWQNLFVYSRLDWEESWEPMDNIGRFELYPTQNTYNFLLLDKKTGRIWQIQWSTESENRGVIAEIE